MPGQKSFAFFVLLFTAFVLAALPAAAPATSGSWTSRQVVKDDLFDVSFVDVRRGWAVGANGVVLATTDGGTSWSRQAAGLTTARLTGVDFVDGDNGRAVGDGDTVLVTADGGITWTKRSTKTGVSLEAVDFVTPGLGWAVGSGASQVFRTDDGGQTWLPQFGAAAGIGLVDVAFTDERNGFAVGYLETSYRTSDGGLTWLPMAMSPHSLGFDSFYAVEALGNGAAVTAGFQGKIYRTDDAGLTWAERADLSRVNGLAAAGEAMFAVGAQGSVARSEDGGLSWTSEASGVPGIPPANLENVAAPSPDLAVAVGRSGIVSRFAGVGSDRVPAVPMDIGSPALDSCTGMSIAWHRAGGSTFVVSAASLDLDGDGSDEAVLGGTESIRAVRRPAGAEPAVVWELPFGGRVQQIAGAQLDTDPGREIIAAAGNNSKSREGVFAVDGDGSLMWSARLEGGAMSVRAADLDGDGIDEAISINQRRSVSFLSGIDGASLRPPTPLEGSPTDLETTDLDSDGVSDVVVSLVDKGAVAINGATGAALWSYPMTEARAVAVGDLNGDGVDDVAAGGYGQAKSLSHYQHPGGTTITSNGALVAAINGRTGARLWDFAEAAGRDAAVRAIAIGDVNRDAKPDVVAHANESEAGHLVALDGRGRTLADTATGEPLPLWSALTTRDGQLQNPSSAESIELADVNGDDAVDAFVALDSGAVVAVSGAPPASGSTAIASIPTADQLWEVTREGAAQRHVSVNRTATGDHLLTVGTDGLTAMRDLRTGALKWEFETGGTPLLAAGDFDGDGREDTGAATQAGRVYTLGSGGEKIAEAGEFLPSGAAGVAAVQVEGDSRPELVAASGDGTVRAIDPRDGRRLWEAKVGGGAASVAAGSGLVAIGTRLGHVVALDATTGRSVWDVVTTESRRVGALVYVPTRGGFVAADGAAALVFLSPAGAVTARATSPEPVGGIAGADVDGDGAEEVVTAGGKAFSSYSWSGKRLGRSTVPDWVNRVAGVDLDGDGRDEIVGVGLELGVYALKGDATERLWYVPLEYPGGVVALDLRGDGREVAVVPSFRQIGTYDIDGKGIVRCDVSRDGRGVILADIDGDKFDEPIVAMEQGDVYALVPPQRDGGTVTPPPPPPVAPVVPHVRGTYPAAPNDPYFGTGAEKLGRPTQWGPRRIGAAAAWQNRRATGFGIKVAVIDSGVDLQHPDLQCPGKLRVTSQSDVMEDGNGPDDVNGHGTHVAGIIGACTQNGRGIAGVAPDSTLLPYQVFGRNGSGSLASIDKAIRLAAKDGAHVINMSLSIGPGIGSSAFAIFFDELDEALAEARDQGAVVIASAGNDAAVPFCAYPALAEQVVCVGATDPRDVRSWYSTFPSKGDENGDGPALVAPGGTGTFALCDLHSEEILSLNAMDLDSNTCDGLDIGYTDMAGTSMAAPHVSGVAALVYDRLGGVRSKESAAAVIEALTGTATDLGAPGFDPVFGSGMVDAVAAVQSAPLPRHALDVSRTGDGGVVSDPAGIDCGTTCSTSYEDGTSVRLVATPARGWRFDGWDGACSGTGECAVEMTATRSVTATFTRITHSLTVSRSGEGTVTSDPAGIACGSACESRFDDGTTVRLTATPAKRGWRFAGWGGACSGTRECSVEMTAAREVTATFRRGGGPR